MKKHSYFNGKVTVFNIEGRIYASYSRYGFTHTLSVCGSDYVLSVHAFTLAEYERISGMLYSSIKAFQCNSPENMFDTRTLF